MILTTHSLSETHAFATLLAAQRQAGDVIALVGSLGAGKTALVQGFAYALGVPRSVPVHSPTFVLLNIYTMGRIPIYHYDWYRLTHAEELAALGPEEYFDGSGVTVVEWADKFPKALPQRTLWVTIDIVGETRRTITMRDQGVTP